MRQVNQRAISVKVDYITMGALDTECFCTGEKRNRVINDAIRLYIELRDARRVALSLGADPLESDIVRNRLSDWFAHWQK